MAYTVDPHFGIPDAQGQDIVTDSVCGEVTVAPLGYPTWLRDEQIEKIADLVADRVIAHLTSVKLRVEVKEPKG